jgi:hypothetical protein
MSSFRGVITLVAAVVNPSTSKRSSFVASALPLTTGEVSTKAALPIAAAALAVASAALVVAVAALAAAAVALELAVDALAVAAADAAVRPAVLAFSVVTAALNSSNSVSIDMLMLSY